MKEYIKEEKLQKQRFDAITSKYVKHKGDIWAQRYRRKFINQPMLENINLSSMKVVDAMCGNGETTRYLVENGAQVTGLDISQKQIDLYQEKFPDCNALCTSILSSNLESNFYDCVVVQGGLHHLHPNVSGAIKEIYRILKVGGFFCFSEPHNGSLPNQIRRYWYKWDSLFAKNEAAIDLETLKREFSSKFKFIKEVHKGNLALLFVYNSIIFRIPLQLKPIYAPPLFVIESMIQKIQGKLLSCFVVCQWKKV